MTLLLVGCIACGDDGDPRSPDAGASGGAAGTSAIANGGDSGGAGRDAGVTDAGSSDAGDASTLGGPCVDGPLPEYCELEGPCPERADALAQHRSTGAAVVVQRSCEEGGRQFVAIFSTFLNHSRTDIFDAATGELVSVYLQSDVPDFCEYRSAYAFYGLALPSCAMQHPESLPENVPELCGSPALFADGGWRETPDECVFIEP